MYAICVQIHPAESTPCQGYSSVKRERRGWNLDGMEETVINIALPLSLLLLPLHFIVTARPFPLSPVQVVVVPLYPPINPVLPFLSLLQVRLIYLRPSPGETSILDDDVQETDGHGARLTAATTLGPLTRQET